MLNTNNGNEGKDQNIPSTPHERGTTLAPQPPKPHSSSKTLPLALAALMSSGVATTLQTPAKADDSTVFYVSGRGGLESLGFNLKDLTKTFGGGLGLETPKLDLNLAVQKGDITTVGAERDVNGLVIDGQQSAYGETLRLPTSMSTYFELGASYYPVDLSPDSKSYRRNYIQMGPSLRLNGGETDWNYTVTDSAGERSIATQNSQIFGGFAGVDLRMRNYEAGDSRKPEDRISFNLNAGYSVRLLGGDLANDSEARHTVLDTDQTVFHGFELGAKARLAGFTFGTTLTDFFGSKIDGLSGPRFMVNFGIDLRKEVED